MIDGRKVVIAITIVAALASIALCGYRAYGWFMGGVTDLKAAAEPALAELAAKDRSADAFADHPSPD
jgi:hypothetical protein